MTTILIGSIRIWHGENGYKCVETYAYLDNMQVWITSSKVELEDGTEITEEYSYDFDNDICTKTRTENGEVTVTKTRISSGEPVE